MPIRFCVSAELDLDLILLEKDALPAAPSHAESNCCYDILEQLRRFT